jgi:hypothetical protein
MKRFVYIPAEMLGDEGANKRAERLSADSRLSIRSGFFGDGIEKTDVSIISTPEQSIYSCDESVKYGFIHSFDITDDFIEFNKNTVMRAKYSNGTELLFKPVVCEKHVIRFRSRHDVQGGAIFNIENDTEIVNSVKVEIL